MPRHFFHVRGGLIEANDEKGEGGEFADEAAAHNHALTCARDLLAAAVIVEDEAGRMILSPTLGEAVVAPPQRRYQTVWFGLLPPWKQP